MYVRMYFLWICKSYELIIIINLNESGLRIRFMMKLTIFNSETTIQDNVSVRLLFLCINIIFINLQNTFSYLVKLLALFVVLSIKILFQYKFRLQPWDDHSLGRYLLLLSDQCTRQVLATIHLKNYLVYW